MEEAIELVSVYWGQDPDVIRHALCNPPDRVRFDLFIPKQEELDEIAREMQKSGLTVGPINLQGLVDDRFARASDVSTAHVFQDILPD
jgi:NitT/TauT family transport system substrate-binding protein